MFRQKVVGISECYYRQLREDDRRAFWLKGTNSILLPLVATVLRGGCVLSEAAVKYAICARVSEETTPHFFAQDFAGLLRQVN